jgi:hypothetical protein
MAAYAKGGEIMAKIDIESPVVKGAVLGVAGGAAAAIGVLAYKPESREVVGKALAKGKEAVSQAVGIGKGIVSAAPDVATQVREQVTGVIGTGTLPGRQNSRNIIR